MTSQTLQFWLPILVIIYLGLIYIWSIFRKYRPIRIQGDVDKKILRKWLGIRLITKVLRVLLMIATFIIISFSYFPDLYSIFYPFDALDRLDINLLGFIILLFSVAWMLVAQIQLSRKINKDHNLKFNSSNVQEIFIFEENILLGILIMLCGVFISISSLFALIVSLVSLSIYFFYYILVVVQQDKFLL